MTDKDKLCKACFHCRIIYYAGYFSCQRPGLEWVHSLTDIASSSERYEIPTEIERYLGECGKEGKFFEPGEQT